MATLVLTVVGGMVGGPMGAAIGAAVGQQIDAQIFKPKGREGPRLADLKIQASTYGQQIPQLFGTMRVAGSVIWATDLIERRSKHGGGKGRASTTEYSYAVSMAVALSSRSIRGIGRIWADGNLLRGSSGTFKERCKFRWYDGSEDQAADPLIASALGIASASAFRGCAYVVFDELELGAFGNRIPSLTFEVEADEGGVDAGLVGNILSAGSARCAGEWRFAGYAASGDRLRDALAPLVEVDGVRLMSGPDGWKLTPPTSAGEPLALADFRERGRSDAPGDRIEHRRAPLSSLPGTIRLRHYEPERDYQLGQQTSRVAGGALREERIDLPAVLPATSARALAQRLAAAAADGLETLLYRADLAALALTVGHVVAMDDGSRWRLAGRTVRASEILLELKRHAPLPVADLSAEPGIGVGAPDWPDAVGTVRLFELPNIGSPAASAPRLSIAGAGSNDGWRGADCWIVPWAGAEPIPIGMVRPARGLGELAEPLGPGSGALFDLSNSIEVRLANPAMTLESVTDAALLGGANRAMMGGELLQFGVADVVGAGRWRLSRLLRGRAGTECDAAHPAGTFFVLLDDPALLALPEPLAELTESGAAIFQWAPRGGARLTEVGVPAAGRALRPLAPVHGQVRPDGIGGVTISWVRRSRVDTGWRDHIDLPLGESREAWRITLSPPVPGIGPWESATSAWAIDAAELAAVPPRHMIEIRQAGDFALSPPLSLPLT
ncbi:phage tail protein [Sphingopyxis sp. USTB-05]|uniref:phage tail protein n=1 Tax=Sphingopyxis sp. USTB-05 TaxID=2830667 RepID=UPI002078B9FB|nr:phage tail protein [Sphingopyxis sp. USTB-05]USI76333.1 phage tail protein [Sphingopyxis sp. USTB-05]